jgi:hypothetical protein
MKNILILIISISILISLTTGIEVLAWEQWEIKRDGTDNGVIMKKKYDYNYSNRYKGTIDDFGNIRMRKQYDYSDRVRGNVDKNGYGYMRDNQGNRYRIRPNW